MSIKAKSSIFNDVIGPVMRGPSSSHTAASWRIARVAMQLLGDDLAEATIEFDRDGGWATNFRSQGTTLGIEGGLLGIDLRDDRILEAEAISASKQIAIRYEVNSFATSHTNTVRLNLWGRNGNAIQVTAVSLGGGMFAIHRINRCDVNLTGDDFNLVCFSEAAISDADRNEIGKHLPAGCTVNWCDSAGQGMMIIRSMGAFQESFGEFIQKKVGKGRIVFTQPIMPVLRIPEPDFPFQTLAEMLVFAKEKGHSLGEIGVIYERCRSGLDRKTVMAMMTEIAAIMAKGISTGLAGTRYPDRILHSQSHLIRRAENQGRVMSDRLVNGIIENISALMEVKSSMGVIVAAPTAGSCGTLGGTIRAIADIRKVDTEKEALAYFAAGMVGVFIAEGPGFSAEEYGCQVECGAVSAMAAAAITELAGGTAAESIQAASLAYQNMIGLVCDPVADRVEVPCLGKNISAAMNALASSTMALAGYDPVIPLDEVIDTVQQVGKTIHRSLRCTGLGGLAATKSAKDLKSRL